MDKQEIHNMIVMIMLILLSIGTGFIWGYRAFSTTVMNKANLWMEDNLEPICYKESFDTIFENEWYAENKSLSNLNLTIS